MALSSKVKLKRLLKRDVEIRPAAIEDLRFFYAGYRLGAFDEYLSPPKNMTPDEFREFVGNYAETAYQIYTATVDGSNPLCVGHTIVAGNRMECHINWMPWATPRNKIEVIAQFLKDMRESYTVLTVVSEENKDALFHIRKYGLMRYVGKYKRYFNNEVGYAFQGV